MSGCPSAAREENLRHERPALDFQILATHDRVQVRARGAQAPTAVDRAVKGGEAFLSVAVHVGGEFVARFLHRFEECAEDGVRDGTAFEDDRTVRASVLVATREAGLHALEVRKTVGVVPLAPPGLGGPPSLL